MLFGEKNSQFYLGASTEFVFVRKQLKPSTQLVFTYFLMLGEGKKEKKALWDYYTHNKQNLNTYAVNDETKLLQNVDEIKTEVSFHALLIYINLSSCTKVASFNTM